MRNKFIVACICSIVLATNACKKETTTPVDPAPAPQQATTLKSITIQGLPSPYVSFEYTDDKKPSRVRIAGGETDYNFMYGTGNLLSLNNNTLINKDVLHYLYVKNTLANIVIHSKEDVPVMQVNLAWNEQKQLTYIQWFDLVNQHPTKIEYLSYNGNNLLKQRTYYWNIAKQEMEWTTTYNYLAYDDKINQGDFLTINNINYHHLLLLPGMRLQQNNATHVTIEGPVNDFDVVNTYEYDGTLPVKKLATITKTRGNGPNTPISSLTEFSYYK